MNCTRRVVVVVVLAAVSGGGTAWIWSHLRGGGGATANRVGKGADDGDARRYDSYPPVPARFAEALKNPGAAIQELEAKYLGVAIGKLEPGTPEYASFNGDCYLLGVLNSEAADDLLATWFARADEDEEPLEDGWRGRGTYPSLQALTLIRRPRPIVLDRMLARAGLSKDWTKLYSWTTHLARKFRGDRRALERLNEQIPAWEGRAAGRYRALRDAVMYGPWGPKGPPDPAGVGK